MLSQQLLQLFIDYQIPSDLLSYDGDEDAPVMTKIERVKELVKGMFEMIDTCQKEQLVELKQETKMDSLLSDKSYMEVELNYKLTSLEKGRDKKEYKVKKRKKGGKMKSAKRKLSIGELEGGAPPPEAPSETASSASEPSGGEKKAEEKKGGEGGEDGIMAEDEGVFDVTKVPGMLEKRFLELDEDAAVRPTTINFGDQWSKKFKKTLIQPVQTCGVGPDEQKTEKNKAFDLLDGLTKSGSLVIDQAEMHVVIAGTHCFDMDLMDTVVKGNVNPIEKVERSSLIFATTIHGVGAEELVAEGQVERVKKYAPEGLF